MFKSAVLAELFKFLCCIAGTIICFDYFGRTMSRQPFLHGADQLPERILMNVSCGPRVESSCPQ